MTEKKMENPYYTLGEAFVASVVAGNRGKITGNQIGLSDRLREYAYFVQENAVEAGDAMLVNDLLDAARQLQRQAPSIQPQEMRDAPYGKHRVQHEGITLECNYFVPGLTLHDLTMLFDKATKSEGVSEYAADPSKWPVVRGVEAVADACIAALTRPEDNSPRCNHWPGQHRCGVCGMDEPPFPRPGRPAEKTEDGQS